MAKTKISEYSSTANSNTDIAAINIDEGCAPSGINNAIRALMAQIHDLYAGTTGDTWPVAGGGTGSGTASGARTNLGLAIGTDVQAYSATLASYANGNSLGFKNRIINGAMMIDQRNAGASVSGDGSFAVDRFNSFKNTGTYTGQRSTDAPAGFTNSYLYTNTSAVTTTYAAIAQILEGFNVADFGWGTANASSVTLSFWVKSSLTGTFGVSFRNSASDRSYVASYTINSANTWEQKSVTVSGDTSGTWLKDNGAGIRVWWDLGVGSGSSTTAGSWQAGNYYGLTSGTKLTGTNGATFYITGVQLEKGSTATSFDYRPYGTELALCQRYYQKQLGNFVGWARMYATGSGSTFGQTLIYPTPMRAAPTGTIIGTWAAVNSSSAAFSSSIYFDSAFISGSSSAAGDALIYSNLSTNGYSLSAEL